jgi:hypothetical protein
VVLCSPAATNGQMHKKLNRDVAVALLLRARTGLTWGVGGSLRTQHTQYSDIRGAVRHTYLVKVESTALLTASVINTTPLHSRVQSSWQPTTQKVMLERAN